MTAKLPSAKNTIRAWVSIILIYLVRSWSQSRALILVKEIMLYIVVFVIAYVADTFVWPTRIEMGREESDLVQEYLKFRKEGETMGDYLTRLEKEEEESIKLHEELLISKGVKKGKKVRKHG